MAGNKNMVQAAVSYFPGRARAARFYRELGHRWRDRAALELDEVESVRILPLMDFYATQPDLETEPGVSYLVDVGDTRILFDLGFNGRNEETPPLLRNMERLSIDPASIDFVVVSHPHSDHLGGMPNKRARRAVLCERDDPLAGKPLFSTVPLKVTGGESRVVDGPMRLAPGVATTGPLPAQLITGYVLEQSLAVRVKGRGMVLIIGCGHPGPRRIIESAERMFRLPIAGIVGGLHYPITEDRRAKGWFKPQKVHGNPNPPWQPLTRGTVRRDIRSIQRKRPGLVALSPHDSCDWAIGAFAEAFGVAAAPVEVGRALNVCALDDHLV